MIDEYFAMPYWVIDILPEQVPSHSPGQYFAIEDYYRATERYILLRQKFCDILLKLNCYYALSVTDPSEEDWERNPDPEALARSVLTADSDMLILIESEKTLITLNRDDTSMTVYHPSDTLLRRLHALTVGEGLYCFQPPQDDLYSNDTSSHICQD